MKYMVLHQEVDVCVVCFLNARDLSVVPLGMEVNKPPHTQTHEIEN